MAKKEGAEKPGLFYNAFKSYVRFLHDKIFYKKTYTINREVLPPNGTPLLIVSNHQNCLNDPLGVLMAFTDRKVNVITRANVFALSPIANKFLRAIGLLPAFRLGWEGEAALDKNKETFKMSEEALIKGNTVLMYPEGGHQQRRWLGEFSFGYTKLAFEAAEMSNFEKEVFILPACNHYSDYFGMQNHFMVKFGTPISLQPFYELYKTKPRTAQREVNKLARKQIEDLMLDIREVEHYEAAYFLSDEWCNEYLQSKDLDPDCLPHKLKVQKEITARLDEAKKVEEPSIELLYKQTRELMKGIEEAGIAYRNLVKAPKAGGILLRILLLILALPLFVVSLWPSLPMYAISMGIFRKKCVDPMFEGTFLFAISALFTLPLFGGLTFGLTWAYAGIGWALAYIALIPGLILLAWKYKECFKRTMQDIRFLLMGEQKAALAGLKKKICGKMEVLMKK